MKVISNRVLRILTISLVCFSGTVFAQNKQRETNSSRCDQAFGLEGVYRIDSEKSDRLYSVIEEATTNVPYAEQQQFFIDLAVRLSPPDLLAIECRGNHVSLGSSRSPRVEFTADGVTRSSRNSGGQTVRSRIGFERNSLIFNSSGNDDTLDFRFTPLENGKSMRVTRRISARELIEPIVIQTVYYKINDVARWDIFDESQVANKAADENEHSVSPVDKSIVKTVRNEDDDAEILRENLEQWIEATNSRDINSQMLFYVPQLKAYYLARNASRNLVRDEKKRVFAAAKSIDVQAAEPEIIFQDRGRSAVMRFRKKYNIVNGSKSRQGEVIQELRWQKTGDGWKIFSERDIKVLS